MTEESDRWRVLLRRHGAALLLFARQWSATRSDAEDAVQEGFVKFWKTRGRARDELAYLYGCVRGAAMDIGRSSRRRHARERTCKSANEGSEFQPAFERAPRRVAEALVA